RLLQFLGSIKQVAIYGTPDEFSNRSARFLGQRQQLLELLFLQEEGCALHGHTVPYVCLYVHRTGAPGTGHGLMQSIPVTSVTFFRWQASFLL
ncbi:MAG TPA: hypothetical protein VMP68_03415, partial [Candidatus Eisenbacteria bacterium]|nr:hypothetical protein [Candidatus Eisenbacteria bacterium]